MEGHMELDRFRQLYQTRVIDRKNGDGHYKNPEWQQYVTKLPVRSFSIPVLFVFCHDTQMPLEILLHTISGKNEYVVV